MSILDNYTQDEIDMMSDEVIQAHKDVDKFRGFVDSIPNEQDNINAWSTGYSMPVGSNFDPLATHGVIKGLL